jgi:hypothetical protein
MRPILAFCVGLYCLRKRQPDIDVYLRKLG